MEGRTSTDLLLLEAATFFMSRVSTRAQKYEGCGSHTHRQHGIALSRYLAPDRALLIQWKMLFICMLLDSWMALSEKLAVRQCLPFPGPCFFC